MFDAVKAQRAINFINNLKHTKGVWHGVPFDLLPWQDKIITDIFGTVKDNGFRQYNTAYVEIPKKNGKSEIAAAVALYLTCADNEWGAEVYGCAADRAQASIVFDVAVDILRGKKNDPTFYPVIYGTKDEEDWSLEENWYKANPSLGHTIPIEKVRDAFNSAKENPAEENIFRQLRLNQWVKQSVRWMPMDIWEKCSFAVDIDKLRGRECYGGLDLSSSNDITAFVLIFPPTADDDKYYVLPFFWISEGNLDEC